jgi:two-component system invasion response regulator UvrY
VEDHPRVRSGICSLLSQDPTLDVVCEAADGEEAVIRAEELQPDLILMDIRLPGITGIEATRRIRRVSRKSQIIFVSQNDSEQMARAAFSTGGQGYVVKSDMGRELLKASSAVRQGHEFVSQQSDVGRELLKAISAVRQGHEFVSQRLIDQGWVN